MITVWVLPFPYLLHPPLGPRMSLLVVLFCPQEYGIHPRMGFGEGARDWLRWGVLPEAPCLTPLLLPAGDAGGRLGGRQNLPAGAVQRRRFPRWQLHFHGWDRLQGKCLGDSSAPARGVWQVSDGRGGTKAGYKDVTLVVPICDSSSRAPQG